MGRFGRNILIAAVCAVQVAGPADASDPVERCRSLAGSKWEQGASTGVRMADIDVAEALTACEAAREADPGPESAYRLLRVIYADKRYEDAFPIVAEVAETGYPLARDALAWHLLTGTGTPADPERGLAILHELEAEGFAPAIARIGDAYLYGMGVERDPAEAARYYVRAAELEEENAIYTLGWMLETGTATEADPAAAATYYQRATDLGSVAAKRNLAFLLEAGRGVDKDVSRAYRLMLEAAKEGDASAQNMMGYYHQLGEITDKDIFLAIDWYGRGLDSGSAAAGYNLGLIHEFGTEVPVNAGRAAEIYDRAAALGHAGARRQLGMMAFEGRGVPLDPARAAALLSEAELDEHPRAQTALAELLLSGTGLERDPERALSLLRAAAKAPHPPAAHRASQLLHEAGREPLAARAYLKAAADAGVPLAAFEWAEYLVGRHPAAKDKEPSASDLKSAFGHYKLAADADVPGAMLRLAWAYFQGKGTEQDVTLGERWAKKARDSGAEGADALVTQIGLWRTVQVKKEQAIKRLCELNIQLCNRGCSKLDDGSYLYNTRDGKHWYGEDGRLVTGDTVPNYSCVVP